MAPWGREQPDYVRAWQAWFTQAMDESGKGSAQIQGEAAALDPPVKISRQMISTWRLGGGGASVNAALAVATIFDRNPVEALRAAGYHPLADQVDRLVREGIEREKLLEQEKYDDDGKNAV